MALRRSRVRISLGPLKECYKLALFLFNNSQKTQNSIFTGAWRLAIRTDQKQEKVSPIKGDCVQTSNLSGSTKRVRKGSFSFNNRLQQ